MLIYTSRRPETIITESDKDDGYFLNCPKTAELYTEDLKFY